MPTFDGPIFAAASIGCVLVVSGVLAAALPSGRVQVASPPLPVRGGTLTFGMGGGLTTINPTLTSMVPEAMIGCGIYEGLVETPADFAAKPLLAKSWTISADGLEYSFQLNKAKWQDGKDFTSADVAYSLIEFKVPLEQIAISPRVDFGFFKRAHVTGQREFHAR